MEKSESGAPIYRYKEIEKDGITPVSGDSSIDEISAHIEKHFGKVELVFHELISDTVHIDIHWVKPSDKFPFNVLITSGMSDLPMTTPPGYEDKKYAELCICLPADWKISESDFQDEANYWPIRWMKILSRFPHEYKTWLAQGHTIPNGDPAQAYHDSTKLNTMLLYYSVILPEEFHVLELPNKKIDFYSLYPLYSEEVNLKLKKGTESLFDGFDKYNVSDVLDINRPNTVRKKFLGLF